MTNTVEIGEPFRYRVSFELDKVRQDLTDYTLEIKVVDKKTDTPVIQRFVTDTTVDNLSFISSITAVETSSLLGIGNFKVCNRLRNSDDTVIVNDHFDLLVGKSCF